MIMMSDEEVKGFLMNYLIDMFIDAHKYDKKYYYNKRLKDFEKIVDDCLNTGEGNLYGHMEVNRNGGEKYLLKISLEKE